MSRGGVAGCFLSLNAEARIGGPVLALPSHAAAPKIDCPGARWAPIVKMAEYKVKFEVFEGPLDLLLYFIKKEEVDIYEVNLTRLATQFIE